MRRVCALIGAAALLILAGCGPTPGPTVYVREGVPGIVSESDTKAAVDSFTLNPSSGKFHRPGCVWAEKIDPERRVDWTGSREDLIAVGYEPCHYCKP